MIEKKLLSDEELDKVTGGSYIRFQGNLAAYSEYKYSISKYAGKVGTKYLFKEDEGHWIFGELINSYEAKHLFGSTRTHDIKVEDSKGLEEETSSNLSLVGTTWVSKWGTREVNGDKYVIYEKR